MCKVNDLLLDVTLTVCKLCKHAYINDAHTTGYCKLNENAKAGFPKIVDELDTCQRWEKK